MARIGTIDISTGLYSKSHAGRVEIARRDSALNVRSYTQEMFRTGVEVFQQEPIRQRHLMDGYARKVLKVPELAWHYRSDGAILRAAADIISRGSDRLKTRAFEIDPGRTDDPLQGRCYRTGDPDLGRVTALANAQSNIESHAALATAELLRLRSAMGKDSWRWASMAVLVRRRAHIPVVERALTGAGIEVSRDLQGLAPLARVKEAVLVSRWLERKERLGRLISPVEVAEGTGWLETSIGSHWAQAMGAGNGRGQWAQAMGAGNGAVAAGRPARSSRHGPRGFYEGGGEGDSVTAISPSLAAEDFVEWAHGWRPEQTGMMVLTAHSTKGLEFDNVVDCDCDWLQGPEITGADRRLFHVAATRARNRLSIVTSGVIGASTRMISDERSEHRAPFDLAPHQPCFDAQSKAPLTPCPVRDVFLSFPAWTGPGRYQDESSLKKTQAVIARSKPGDRLRICKAQNGNDRNPWHVFARCDGGWHRVGKMLRGFEPNMSSPTCRAQSVAPKSPHTFPGAKTTARRTCAAISAATVGSPSSRNGERTPPVKAA